MTLCAAAKASLEPRDYVYWGLSPQGFHKLAYVEWGDPENPDVLVCLHGLIRNGRDFDYLAHSLKHTYRIICPDLVGRGKSDYIGDASLYTVTQYVNDMVALLGRLKVEKVHWLGTSLGGIIGMMLAAQPQSPLQSLILNDVGMIVPNMALQRLGMYARNETEFSNLEDAISYFQAILAPIGALDPKKWEHITKHGTLASSDGKLRLAYDPAIGDNFVNQPVPTLHLETYWQAIKCPVLILRGEESDCLTPDILTKMLYSQPGLKTITFPACGHAPSLMEKTQIQVIENWLGGHSPQVVSEPVLKNVS